MSTPNQESERLITIAREYKQKGYKILLQSPSTDWPDFLKDHEPDLVALGKDENVVIEVKSRSSLSSDIDVQELAHLVEAEPGWRFELVLVRENPVQSAPNDSSPHKGKEIKRSIEAANFLEEGHFNETALVSAWTALEAAIRLQCEREDVELVRFTPDYLLKQAVTYGIVSRDEYHDLLDAMKYRNAFVHGFKLERFEPSLIRYLNDFASRIVRLSTQEI